MTSDRGSKNSNGKAAAAVDYSFSRRSFIGKSAGVALAIGGSSAFLAACGDSGGSGSGGEVAVLTFEAYIDPEMDKLWREAYPDITLKGIPAADDSELFTKLKAGGADAYDVVFCDFGYCPLFRSSGLVEDLNLADFESANNLYPEFREDTESFSTYLLEPDVAIGYPCQWAPTAMTFNTTVDVVPTAPYSWAQMWDPGIPENSVGFEGLPPEGFIATAALAKGFDRTEVYDLSGADLDGVVDYFREIKPFRTFDADPITRNALRTGDVWIALTPTPGFGSKINEEAGSDVALSVVPEEGSIGYIDGPMLVKDAKNRDNAMKYIEWFAGNEEVRNYVFTTYRGSPCFKTTVEAALEEGGLKADLVEQLQSNKPEVAQAMVLGQPPTDPKAYTAAWDQINA
jgi:spermidine/putrescine transport system substrate-binding protein